MRLNPPPLRAETLEGSPTPHQSPHDMSRTGPHRMRLHSTSVRAKPLLPRCPPGEDRIDAHMSTNRSVVDRSDTHADPATHSPRAGYMGHGSLELATLHAV